MKKTFTLIILITTIFSCSKPRNDQTPEERQTHQEQKEPLKSNELLEEDGLTFLIRSPITDPKIIDIHLKLFKGSGAAKSDTISLNKNSHMNYSILSEQLQNNS